jgi:hypothetical protein
VATNRWPPAPATAPLSQLDIMPPNVRAQWRHRERSDRWRPLKRLVRRRHLQAEVAPGVNCLTMRDCWASCLNNCVGKLTREHYVSANILGAGPIRVRGLPWCRDDYRELPPTAFTRNMLCGVHNSGLSPLDQFGGAAWKELKIFAASVANAKTIPRGARPSSFRVQSLNGSLFERWLLKTVINLTYASASQTDAPWSPPPDWVEIVFGAKGFPRRCGLYLDGVTTGALVGKDSYFGLRILTSPGTDTPCGGQFRIDDWGFVVSMLPLAAQFQLRIPRQAGH